MFLFIVFFFFPGCVAAALNDKFLYSGPTGWWVKPDLVVQLTVSSFMGRLVVMLSCRVIFHVAAQTSRRCKLRCKAKHVVDRDLERWRVPCFLCPIGHYRRRRNNVGVSLCKNANFKELWTPGLKTDPDWIKKFTRGYTDNFYRYTSLFFTLTTFVFVFSSDIKVFQDEVCKIYNEECCYAKCTKTYRLLREIFSIAVVNEAVSGFRWVSFFSFFVQNTMNGDDVCHLCTCFARIDIHYFYF